MDILNASTTTLQTTENGYRNLGNALDKFGFLANPGTTVIEKITGKANGPLFETKADGDLLNRYLYSSKESYWIQDTAKISVLVHNQVDMSFRNPSITLYFENSTFTVNEGKTGSTSVSSHVTVTIDVSEMDKRTAVVKVYLSDSNQLYWQGKLKGGNGTVGTFVTPTQPITIEFTKE